MKLINFTFFLFYILLSSCISGCGNRPIEKITIVCGTNASPTTTYGLSKLYESLAKKKFIFENVHSLDEAKGNLLVAVNLLEKDLLSAQLHRNNDQKIPSVPESYIIWRSEWNNRPIWVINASDERGLLYGILELTDKVKSSQNVKEALAAISNTTEQADVSTRAISLYTMHRKYWESRFYDENYWAKYMDMLVENRFNSMVVIFGYENGGFLAPSYPYFFNVEGFPGVRMQDINAQEQQRNLNSLRRMIEMAHERGLEFKVGIWDHVYRGGVQQGGVSDEEFAKYTYKSQVDGLAPDNLLPYTRLALEKFIRTFPDLDGIQFRMHYESGLKNDEMHVFWSGVFRMIKEKYPDFRLDLRAKELPDEIIQSAADIGLNFTITTKYWMEQMGLPFHPTHINRQNQHDRRHGYADLLKYPKSYNMHWKMWTGGTQRILLWGDPEYTRRFAESTHLYDGDGFEVNEPLATKMETQPHGDLAFDLLNPSYQYYEYEFERYWYFFKTFGRIGYNPNTSAQEFTSEFENRFGHVAGPILQDAIHKASWILPRIVASCAPYGKFPTTRGWPEKQRFGELPDYAAAEGSDIQLFASFKEEANILIEGGETAKVLPSATSQWFKETSDSIIESIARAESEIEDSNNKEFISTITDLKILANLALYHSRRIPAAVSYKIFETTNDPSSLDEAIRYETDAIEAWKEIVVSAGDVYTDNLALGVRSSVFVNIDHRMTGHWKDELGFLENGLEMLKMKRMGLSKDKVEKGLAKYKLAVRSDNANLFEISHEIPSLSVDDEHLEIKINVKGKQEIKWVRLRHRPVNQTLDYDSIPMTRSGDDTFIAKISKEDIVPNFDFMYFFEIMDISSSGTMYPDFNKEAPYIIIKLNRKG